MRYFVAYLLNGDAGAYHENLTRTLSERFGVRPLHEWLPPHITLKAPFDVTHGKPFDVTHGKPFDVTHGKPFETDSVSEIETVLEEFARRAQPAALRLKGFDRFGSRTVVMNVLPSEEMIAAVAALPAELRALAWMEFARNERVFRPHASVARFLSPRQFAQVWNYVQILKEPRFDLIFDHVALLEKPGRRWEVMRTFPLGAVGN